MNRTRAADCASDRVSGKDRFFPVMSWAFYDFANTIFYAVVVTRYLPDHIKSLTGRHSFINWGFYPAMVTAAFLAPWLGRFAGRRGVSKRSVLALTLCCALCTAALAVVRNPWPLIVFFALAQISYQLALVPYNNLLPAVASPARMGRVSGLGVALGYAGVILSLWIVEFLMREWPGQGTAYLAAAVLFLLFTIPLVFFVPEKPSETMTAQPGAAEFIALLRERGRRRFIIGNFLCADALNAILVFVVVYLKWGLHFDKTAILFLLTFLNIAAFAGGFLTGWLSDRLTHKKVMILSAACLGSAIALGHFSGNKDVTFWSIILLGGPGVAGLWVAGRKWVVELSPGTGTGAFFGVYGLTNKLSILNLVLFALLADWTGGYTWSILIVLASLAVGMVFLLSAPSKSG